MGCQSIAGLHPSINKKARIQTARYGDERTSLEASHLHGYKAVQKDRIGYYKQFINISAFVMVLKIVLQREWN